MQFKHVTLDIDGPVAILKLDHQEVMNAVSMDMLGGLAEALDTIDEKKAEVRCVVLTGAGRAFCTGANLQGRNNQKPGKSNAGSSLETGFHPFLRRLRNLHCPIVTAVNGPAAGAGMSFALMGDMILCARSSYFLQAFRRIGLVPDCGSTWLLPRLIGKARSVELSLMGERLPAEKALEWGLVNRVHDDAVLMEETMKLAHELANGPDHRAVADPQAVLGQPGQLVRGSAQPRSSSRSGWPVRPMISRKASPRSSRSVPPNSRADDAGSARALRRVVVSGRYRRHQRSAAVRRRQPGDLVVRHRPSRRQYRRDPAPRAAGPWRVVARSRAGCRVHPDAARIRRRRAVATRAACAAAAGRTRHRLHHGAGRGRNHPAQDPARCAVCRGASQAGAAGRQDSGRDPRSGPRATARVCAP